MLGLTVQAPWPWAMVHCGKTFENRSRGPDKRLQPGDVFLIHQGKGLGEWKGVERWDEWPPVMTPMVRYVEDVGRPEWLGYPFATAVYDGCDIAVNSPWYVQGRVAWKLKDVVQVSPSLRHEIGVVRGALTLFELEPLVAAKLMHDRLEQLRA
jgi:hypothetical protein